MAKRNGRGRLAMLLCLLLLLPALARAECEAVWSIQIGGAKDDELLAMGAVVQDGADAGLILVGFTTKEDERGGTAPGDRDAWAVRVSSAGEVLWQTSLGGGEDDAFTHVLSLADGGFLCAGSTHSDDGDVRNHRGGKDIWIVRLDAQGGLVWQKCLGGTREDTLLAILAGEDNTFVFAGMTKSHNGDLTSNNGGTDAWAGCINGENGRVVWQYRKGDGGDDAFTHILPAPQGWLLLGAYAVRREEGAFEPQPAAVLLDAAGNMVWDVPLGGSGMDTIRCALVRDNGWMLAGTVRSADALIASMHGEGDAWLVFLRQNGLVSWQRALGGADEDAVTHILQRSGTSSVLLGTTRSNSGDVSGAHGETDVWAVQVSGTGALQWQQALGGSEASEPAGIVPLDDGGYLVVGTTFSHDGDVGLHDAPYAGWLARLGPNGNLHWTRVLGEGRACAFTGVLRGGADQAYLLGRIMADTPGVAAGDAAGDAAAEERADAWIVAISLAAP